MEAYNFVTIASQTYARSILLKSRLEMAGIPCFLANIGDPNGVEVRISEKDAAAAFNIVEEVEQASGEGKEVFMKTLRSIRRIMVPIDFSPMSIKAARYALELARVLKADIRLVHVWFSQAGEPIVFNEVYAYQVNFEGLLKEQEDEARQRIESLCNELKQRVRKEKIRGTHIDYKLIRGIAIDEILQMADEYKPGLLVMGTRGKAHEGHVMMGSTTAKVIEKCRVPVLTIPLHYDAEAFEQPSRIMYITNFDDSDFINLHKLIAFVRPFKVKIYCVHVHIADSVVLDEARMKKMREHFDREYSTFNIECGLIESGDLLEGIESFVQEKQIDVISLVSHKRSLISQLLKPGLTRKILFQSEIPLLVFRDVQ
ncbi:MAG: universal stress protein [Bacteroidetes bacterium]|nr:universal stress protein [Bacteroidota bacterium]